MLHQEVDDGLSTDAAASRFSLRAAFHRSKRFWRRALSFRWRRRTPNKGDPTASTAVAKACRTYGVLQLPSRAWPDPGWTGGQRFSVVSWQPSVAICPDHHIETWWSAAAPRQNVHVSLVSSSSQTERREGFNCNYDSFINLRQWTRRC